MKKLTVNSFRELFPRAKVRRYAKNQIICYNGDRPHHVFFVLKGHLKYYDIDNEGNEKILHIIGPQNTFPMLYAFKVSPDVSGFYASLDSVELITIPLEEFHQQTATNIKFSNELTRWFLTEIQQLMFRIHSFEKTDSKIKVLQALKYLAVYYGHKEDKWYKLNFVATQQFLADFTGLTRETVSITIQQLEKKKIIQTGKDRFIKIKRTQLERIGKL